MQNMKMTESNVFVVLTFAALLSKLLQRKPKQEQLTISKTTRATHNFKDKNFSE